MTNRTRLFIFTGFLVLGTFFGIGIVGYKMGASSLHEGAKQRLLQARTFKTRELENDLKALNQSLYATANIPELKVFLKKAPAQFKNMRIWLTAHGVERNWRSLIASNSAASKSPEAVRILTQMSPAAIYVQSQFIEASLSRGVKARSIESPSKNSFPYFKSLQLIHPLLSEAMEKNQFADIILVDSSGNIIYTVQKDLDFGVNLLTGVFANSRMAQAYRWSQNAPEGTSKFFDFAPMAHFWNMQVGFLTTPLFDQSRYIGTLIVQIPIQRINDLLSNGTDWTSLGIGKTGEVVAFGSEGFMRNNSRHFFENPDNFLKEFHSFNHLRDTTELVRRNQSTSLVVSLPGDKIKEFLDASPLTVTNYDYRGVRSLQSVGTVTFTEGAQWIIIAKMSENEIYAPLYKSMRNLTLGAVVLLSLALLGAHRFSQQLYRPFHVFSAALSRLRQNDFTSKLPLPNDGELRPLAEEYNNLTENLLKIKNTKEFLQATVQSVHEAFFIVEAEPSAEEDIAKSLIIRGVNPAASKMVGINGTSLKGAPLQMWIDTDYEKIICCLKQPHMDAFSFEGVLKKISGEKIPLEISWAPIKPAPDGKNILVVLGRDIRWKKSIEKELRLQEALLMESQALSKTGSFRWEINTGVCIWTEEEYHILGFDPRNTRPTYELFRSQIFSEDLTSFDEALKNALKKMTPFVCDFRIKKGNSGEIIWVRSHGRTEYDDYGNALYMYGTTQDITELRRVEQSLIAAKNDALKSSQAKSEFLAHMSHEIRTPMNSIMGMAELLNETNLNDDQKYYVTIFRKAGEVLMALINDILDLSKIEAGEVSIENIPFDLQKMMIDVEDMMKPRAQEKGINYSFEIAPGVSPYLMGDPTKLRQVLINLVGNSLKFTETGYIRVTIGKNPSKKDTLMFAVTDSGTGIPAAKQHLIFQKFSQADSSITRKYGGTGLGLAISKSLIELMGGQIWFKSRENMGTTFFFTIPHREQVYNPVTHQSIQMQHGDLNFAPQKQRDPNKKIRILIADDTEDNRTLFTHYLKNEPYEIIEAENGLEAIDKIKSEKFDIVFMDVQMPEMDGYAATNKIREWETEEHKDHTPIIALTAHALSEDKQKSLRAGCDDHIAKPFKKGTLLDIINHYLL